jgi:O-antigen/teichoic acid export membrane protein
VSAPTRTIWARGTALLAVTGRAVVGPSLGNALLNGATVVLNLAIALLLSHLIGAEGLGAYSFAIAWVMLLAVPAVMGLPSLVVREVATYRLQERWGNVRGVLRRANQTVVVAGILFPLGFAVSMWLLDWPRPQLREPTLLALPIVLLVAVVSIRQSAMQGFGRVILGRIPEGLASPALAIVLVAALDLALGSRFSASWAVCATVLGVAGSAILGAVLLRRTMPAAVRTAEPRYETREWSRAALPLATIAAIQTVNAQIGLILIGVLRTAREAGIFGVVNRAAGLIPFLLLAIVPVVMPRLAVLRAEGDGVGLQRVVTQSARLALYGSLPVVILLLVAPNAVLSLFGHAFENGDTALQILCVGQLVNVATGLAGTVLIMIRRVDLLTVGVTVGTVVNVLLCVLLIPAFGVNGAAVATSAGVVATNLLLVLLLWRHEHIYSPSVRLRAARETRASA